MVFFRSHNSAHRTLFRHETSFFTNSLFFTKFCNSVSICSTVIFNWLDTSSKSIVSLPGDSRTSFNSLNLDKFFNLFNIADALTVPLSNDIDILDPVFLNLILFLVKKSVILSESEADS